MSKDFCDIMDQLRYMATSTGELQRKYPGSPPKSVCSSGTADRKGLAKSIRQRQQSLSQARQDLLNTRERIMLLACEVLNAHTTCLGLGVRTLEQTIHGSVARGTRAQAEYLSTVAEGVSGKSRYGTSSLRSHMPKKILPFLNSQLIFIRSVESQLSKPEPVSILLNSNKHCKTIPPISRAALSI